MCIVSLKKECSLTALHATAGLEIFRTCSNNNSILQVSLSFLYGFYYTFPVPCPVQKYVNWFYVVLSLQEKKQKKNKTHPVAANSRPGQEHTLSDVETRERISCLMLSGSVLSVILTISALPPFAALRSDSAPKCTTASSGLWNWAHILELTLCQRKTTILHGHGNRANSFR